MPTKREREYYAMGFRDGVASKMDRPYDKYDEPFMGQEAMAPYVALSKRFGEPTKPKRKLSAWNKFVKANSKKPRFRMRSGKLNLKKMAVAFRRQRKR